MLIIKELNVEKGEKSILCKVNAVFGDGKTILLIGPNGSGKSTLAQAIMGDPFSSISGGEIVFNGQKLNSLSADQRASLGIFVSWQHPLAVEGINAGQLLRIAYSELSRAQEMPILSQTEFDERLKKACLELEISDELIGKSLGSSLSGGERKMLELLQILILEPGCIILDEIDAGLDADGKNTLVKLIKSQQKLKKTLIIISHNPKLYEKLQIDQILLMQKGAISTLDQKTLENVNQNGYRNL